MAGGPSVAELIERADQRRRRGVGVPGRDILAAVRELRDENGE